MTAIRTATIDSTPGVPSSPLATGQEAIVTVNAHEDIVDVGIVQMPLVVTMPDGTPAEGVINWPVNTHDVVSDGYSIAVSNLPAGLTVTAGPGPKQITFHQA